ncbi:hypothetical protein D3C80_761480 [compost metagenome]
MRNIAVILCLVLVLVTSCRVQKKHKEESKRDSVAFSSQEFKYKSLDSLRSTLLNMNYQRTVEEFESFRDSTGKITPVLKKITSEQLTINAKDSSSTKSTQQQASNANLISVQEDTTKSDNQIDSTVRANFPWLPVLIGCFGLALLFYFFVFKK